MSIIIATDGSKTSKMRAGYAVVSYDKTDKKGIIIYDRLESKLLDSVEIAEDKITINYIDNKSAKTTNNRGELMAIMVALTLVKEFDETKEIVIVSDSDYSINCITEWGPNWIKKGIVNKCNTDIIYKCIDLYNELLQSRQIKFVHVNSHLAKRDIDNMEGDKKLYYQLNAKADEFSSKVGVHDGCVQGEINHISVIS